MTSCSTFVQLIHGVVAELSVAVDVGPLDEEGLVLVDRIGREEAPALPEEGLR